MALRIKLKNSVVQDRVPTTSDLPEVGELAVNANINSIGGFMRASDNSVVKIFGPGSLSTPTATTSVSGISELATNSETTTGTATNRVVTPAGLNAVTVAERSTSNSTYLALAGGTLTGVLAATAGSNSAPSIHFGDSDSGIFGGTDTVSLAAGGTTRLTAGTGVNINGTLAVTGAITSTSNLTIADKIIHAGDTDTSVRFPSDNTISFETNSGEALRVSSTRRLLLGTTSQRSVAVGDSKLQIENSTYEALSVVTTAADDLGTQIALGKTRNGAIIQDDDSLGKLSFAGDDGTDLNSIAAKIEAFVDGTPGSNDMPGRLEFKTTADGAASPTTRLTIDSAGLVKLPDNGKFVAGAGLDLQIYHDGSNSYINHTNSSGDPLYIQSENDIRIRVANTEEGVKVKSNGAVELYHDGSKKFETTSSGAEVFGRLLTEGVFIPDGGNGNVSLSIGTNNDLRLYHDGSNSYILDRGTGGLSISGSQVSLDSSDFSEYMIKAVENGAVELYYNGTKRIETNNTGAFITGELGCDTLYMGDNEKAKFGNNDDLEIFHDGSTASIIKTKTGDQLTVRSDLFWVRNSANSESIIKGIADGAVELYHNGSKKFETTANGATFLDNVSWNDNKAARFGGGDDLQIYHDATNSYIDNQTGVLYLRNNTGTYNGHGIQIQALQNENAIVCNPNAAVELYHDNSKKFETASHGATLTGNLRLPDNTSGNASIQLGNSQDFFMNHNGTDSFIINNTGNLYIRDLNGDVHIQGKDSEESIIAKADGAVELYHNNSKKFETKSFGAQVTGELYSDGLRVGDNEKIRIGENEDLQIFHDGTHSQIKDASSGELLLSGSTISLNSANSAEYMLRGIENAGVELYHDNSKKFETTSTGNQSTGVHKFITGSGSTSSDDNVLHIVAGGQATRGIMIGTGRGGGVSQNDGMGFIDAIDSESNGHGAQLQFRVDGTAVMSVGSQANDFVGINTTTPAVPLDIVGSIRVRDDDDDAFQGLRIINTKNNANAPDSAFIRLGVTNAGGEKVCSIRALQEGNAANAVGLTFNTNTSGGNNSETEKMRITSDGRVLIGATSKVFNEFLSVQKGGDSTHVATFYFNDTQAQTAVIIKHDRAGHQGDGTTATMIGFLDQTNGTSGSITSNGSSTSFNQSSDYRLKENEIVMSDGITRLKALKPYRFNFKVDTTRTLDGFFAHEVQSVVPEAVTGEKDAVDKAGNIDPQQLDQSKLVPLLVAAVQELIGKVEALEAA